MSSGIWVVVGNDDIGQKISHISSLFFAGNIVIAQTNAFMAVFAIPGTVMIKYSTKSHSEYDVFKRREAITRILLVHSIT